MVKEFFVLVKREFYSLRNEKTILMAVFVQLLIALLSTSIMEGVMAFYNPEFLQSGTRDIAIGITGTENSTLEDYLAEQRISVIQYPGYAEAEASFLSGKIDAILNIPEKDPNEPVSNIQLYLPKLESRKTVVLIALDKPLKEYENYLREQDGVTMQYQELSQDSFSPYEFLYTALVPILMLFPALVAGSMVIDTICEEHEHKTLDTLLSGPVTLRMVYSSKIFVGVITAAVQIGLWSLLLIWNKIDIFHLPMLLLLAVSYSISIAFGASIIAGLLRDRERSQFLYSMLLIIIGAGSYFLGYTPVSVITSLASGAPNFELSAYIAFLFVPVPLTAVFYLLFVNKR